MKIVVITCGEPERGCATRGTFAHPHSASGMAHSYSHRERFCAILAQLVFPVKRTVGARTATSRVHHNAKSVRSNLCRPFKATGDLILLCNARFQPVQKSSRSIANAFHLPSSFVAPASELQCATGVVGNVRKAFGEIRNVEC